jgi:hypothetical protein
MHHPRRSFAPLLLGTLLLGALPAAAQPFEAIYGPATSADQGARRVKPVNLCTGGGFVAAGTRNSGAAASQVYVVRTNAAGVSLWEHSYDLGGGNQDEGRALAELSDGSGFVVLGNNFTGASWQTVLLKINCSGTVLWSNNYRWPAFAPSIRGLDLIETRHGDSAFGTAAGDLAVAGYVTSGGNDDAFLLRTRSNGTPIWNRAYKLSGQERFNALTEATPSYGAPAGDFVAAGSLSVGTDSQALTARVDGNSGLYGGPNRCVSNYGNADDVQTFFSVIELQTAPYAGHLAFGGLSNGAAYSDDIYLLRTQANPCVPAAQARLGDQNQPNQIDREVALDLREVLWPLASAGLPPVGSLVLTGDVADVPFTMADVPLLAVAPGNFGVLFGRIFGSQLPRTEVAFSLERIPTAPDGTIHGYVMAGFSTSDREGAGDPRDLYMVATDGNLDTQCSRLYQPVPKTLPWPMTLNDPTTYQPATWSSVATLRVSIDTDYPVCP